MERGEARQGGGDEHKHGQKRASCNDVIFSLMNFVTSRQEDPVRVGPSILSGRRIENANLTEK